MLRITFPGRVSVESGARVRQLCGRFQLTGEGQQQILASVGGDQLHAHRCAGGGVGDREADRRLTSDVPYAHERAEASGVVGHSGLRLDPADGGRKPCQRRREQHLVGVPVEEDSPGVRPEMLGGFEVVDDGDRRCGASHARFAGSSLAGSIGWP